MLFQGLYIIYINPVLFYLGNSAQKVQFLQIYGRRQAASPVFIYSVDLVKSLLNSVFLVVLTLSIQILAKHPWWATKQKEKIAANPWCELQRTETIVVKPRLALQRR